MVSRKKMAVALAGFALLVAGVVGAWSFPDGSTIERGPWQAFDENWFRVHQDSLLGLLNGASTSHVARLAFAIRDCDCPPDERIARIGPNRITYGVKRLEGGDIQATTDFRTHWKFSKRVYRIAKPAWWLAHLWDKLADRYAPSTSFGLSTLTVFSDPGPTGTTSKSGWANPTGSGSSSWATLHASSGQASSPSLLEAGFYGDSASNCWVYIMRAVVLFDTSSLTASANVTAGVVSIAGTSKADPNSNTPNTDIYISNPASNVTMQSSDFENNAATTSQTGSPISYASFFTGGYNAYTLNTLGGISKTSISKYGWKNANKDVANVAPTWGSFADSRTFGVSADNAGTSQDPKLVVTYTIPAAAGSGLMIGGD